MPSTVSTDSTYSVLQRSQRLRVSDGEMTPVLPGAINQRTLVLMWPQLGDFDSLEYAWWIRRERDRLGELDIDVRAVGIGDRQSGEVFCEFTGFPTDRLWMDATGELHRELGLYEGLTTNWPVLSSSQQAWVNLMLMCAGIASPGTLAEVFRGYRGDRKAPQLIADDETIETNFLPPLKGKFFGAAGGSGFQRPFELATVRLKNMVEVLSKWSQYVPDASYMTQRGGTFLFDTDGQPVYEYRDRGILGFAENMANPLEFLGDLS
ncbi:MAG: peroxiredoxin-like family protein [Cyanobacteria bacterium P01_C01_bin.89]